MRCAVRGAGDGKQRQRQLVVDQPTTIPSGRMYGKACAMGRDVVCGGKKEEGKEGKEH